LQRSLARDEPAIRQALGSLGARVCERGDASAIARLAVAIQGEVWRVKRQRTLHRWRSADVQHHGALDGRNFEAIGLGL
jgi:hypothetical protein